MAEPMSTERVYVVTDIEVDGFVPCPASPSRPPQHLDQQVRVAAGVVDPTVRVLDVAEPGPILGRRPVRGGVSDRPYGVSYGVRV